MQLTSIVGCVWVFRYQYATTFIEQLVYLTHRNCVNTMRTREIFFVRAGVMITLSLCLATLYLGLVCVVLSLSLSLSLVDRSY